MNVLGSAPSDVLHFYLGNDLIHGKPVLGSVAFPTAQASASIPIYGRRVFGSMAVLFDKIFLSAIARTLFPGITPDDDLNQFNDVLGEMLNQIAGKVKIQLGELGVLINIGLPRILQGADAAKVQHPVAGHTMRFPYEYRGGTCFVEVCLGNSLSSEHVTENFAFEVFVSG